MGKSIAGIAACKWPFDKLRVTKYEEYGKWTCTEILVSQPLQVIVAVSSAK